MAITRDAGVPIYDVYNDGRWQRRVGGPNGPAYDTSKHVPLEIEVPTPVSLTRDRGDPVYDVKGSDGRWQRYVGSPAGPRYDPSRHGPLEIHASMPAR